MPIKSFFFTEPSEGCAVQDSLLFQNLSSSMESAHANTEVDVSRHCLDSSGKSMPQVIKGRNFSQWEENFLIQKNWI